MKWMEIDGSHGEGGGQQTRLALALAAITGQPLHLINIRSGRAKPGLMPQHLAAVRAVAALCQGGLDGEGLGNLELYFRPGRIRGGDYRFEVGTAGSITLVLQAVLPVALRADAPCQLTLTGGTDVRMAPPLDYLREVFLPWLGRMGGEVQVLSVRRGYYPQGGGELRLSITPCHALRPLWVESAGALETISGLAHVAHLPSHIPERMAASARAGLADLGPVHIATRILGQDEAKGAGGALVLVARAQQGLMGAAVVAERGVPAERLGHQASLELLQDLQAGAAMDVHAADQLLAYAALATGESRFLVRQVSAHAKAAMWLIQQCLPVGFEVEQRDGLSQVTVRPGAGSRRS